MAETKTLLVADKATVVMEATKDGKIRLTGATWEDARVVLPGQVLEARNIGSGRLSLALVDADIDLLAAVRAALPHDPAWRAEMALNGGVMVTYGEIGFVVGPPGSQDFAVGIAARARAMLTSVYEQPQAPSPAPEIPETPGMVTTTIPAAAPETAPAPDTTTAIQGADQAYSAYLPPASSTAPEPAPAPAEHAATTANTSDAQEPTQEPVA